MLLLPLPSTHAPCYSPNHPRALLGSCRADVLHSPSFHTCFSEALITAAVHRGPSASTHLQLERTRAFPMSPAAVALMSAFQPKIKCLFGPHSHHAAHLGL